MKIGYATLGKTDGVLASTRITILNTFEKLREKGYSPEILDEPNKYDPDRDVSGIVDKTTARGFVAGDIVYFQSLRHQSVIDAVRELRSRGIGTVFGVCNYMTPEMVEACDATVVPTKKLRECYPERLRDKIFLVHDGIEFPECQKTSYESSERLKLVFMTGKRYEFIRGLFVPDDVDLTVIGPYDGSPLESFRIPSWLPKSNGVRSTSGLREFTKEIWSLESYLRMADFDIGVIPVDLREPMARADMAPTHTRSSNKLTQMMSTGLPVIAGPLPAYFDIITHGEDGFIVETDGEWLEAFDQLRDEEERERIGKAARARVMHEFSLDEQVSKLVEVFEKHVF